MRLPAYTAYKDSGVEWLGEVPEHWSVKRGRFLMQVNPRAPRLRALKPEDEVSFVPMDAVGEYGGLRLDQTKQIDEVGSGYTEFQDGDVVVAKITPCFENGKGALAQNLQNGVAYGTTELHVLRAFPTLEQHYLFYLTISSLYREAGESEMYGAGGQKRVPPEFNKDFRTPLPPLGEQRTIADFLDVQTAKIDTLLAKKRDLIDKLKEKRTALISRTVTRGLPPDAAIAAGLDPYPPMKPSGIDWLGDIPQQWEVKRLKYLGSAQIGLTYDPSEVVSDGEGTLVLRSSNVQNGKISTDDNVYVQKYIPKKLVTREGDILICSRNGSRALIGKNAMIDSESAGVTFGAFMTIYRSYANRFLYWVFNSPLFEYQSGSFLTSTINQLTVGNLNSFEVPLPPESEQTAITNYLHHETKRINGMIDKVEKVIQRLQEYRTALITSAVTGKIDVRGAAA